MMPLEFMLQLASFDSNIQHKLKLELQLK